MWPISAQGPMNTAAFKQSSTITMKEKVLNKLITKNSPSHGDTF